jgi:formylglycine-generating enzyme required for sulfatase activity
MSRGAACALPLLLAVLACGSDRPDPVVELPKGLVVAEGADNDPVTGLPTRILHADSGIALVLIPAGEFMMGSPEAESGRTDAERRHRRIVRRPFYLGETEVTAGQFRLFADATGYRTDAERGTPDGDHALGSFAALPEGNRAWNAKASWRDPFPDLPDVEPRDDLPVLHVSWSDARAFAAHFGLRLPTEAEWEHACRAGTTTRFFWGESEAVGQSFANVAPASAQKRFPQESSTFPFDDGVAVLAPVGSYHANPWGLRDILGNVEEWCEDTFAEYPADGADERAAMGGSAARVLRGGGWVGNTTTTRCAARAAMGESSRRDFIGFRVALDAPANLNDNG